MNEAVFKAIGELLKEQQDLTTEQIKKLEDDIFEQITLVKLKEGAPGAPGEDGKDADPEAVAEIIVEKYADTLKGEAGRDGQDGQDGRDVSVEEILNHAKSDDDFLDRIKAKDGQDGAPGLPGADGREGLGIETKAFSAGEVYREGSYVTSHFGQTFKALRDTVNDVDSQDWERVGSGGFRFTGPVSKDFDYQDGDLFVKDFGLFLVVKGENKLVAGRGPRGEKGEKGISGVDGRDGSQVEEVDLIDGSLVILSKDHEGNFSRKSVELTPILDMVAHIANDSVTAELELMPDLVKSIIDRTLTAHVDDPQAIPMRFFRGPWQGTDSYQTGDVVSYGMAIYIALNSSSGIIPEGGILNRQDAKKHWRMILHTDVKALLPKGRADRLYGLDLWDKSTDWEHNSIVRYKANEQTGYRYFKATGSVITGEHPVPGANHLVIDVLGLPVNTPGDPVYLHVHGGPLVNGGMLDIGLEDDANGIDDQTVTLAAGMTNVQVAAQIIKDWSSPNSTASAVDKQTIMVSPNGSQTITDCTPAAGGVLGVNTLASGWTDITPDLRLRDLVDCQEAVQADDGFLMAWSSTNQRWEPMDSALLGGGKDLHERRLYIGNSDYDKPNMLGPRFGMPADAVPDPLKYPPRPGDQYHSKLGNVITEFSGWHHDSMSLVHMYQSIHSHLKGLGWDAFHTNFGIHEVDVTAKLDTANRTIIIEQTGVKPSYSTAQFNLKLAKGGGELDLLTSIPMGLQASSTVQTVDFFPNIIIQEPAAGWAYDTATGNYLRDEWLRQGQGVTDQLKQWNLELIPHFHPQNDHFEVTLSTANPGPFLQFLAPNELTAAEASIGGDMAVVSSAPHATAPFKSANFVAQGNTDTKTIWGVADFFAKHELTVKPPMTMERMQPPLSGIVKVTVPHAPSGTVFEWALTGNTIRETIRSDFDVIQSDYSIQKPGMVLTMGADEIWRPEAPTPEFGVLMNTEFSHRPTFNASPTMYLLPTGAVAEEAMSLEGWVLGVAGWIPALNLDMDNSRIVFSNSNIKDFSVSTEMATGGANSSDPLYFFSDHVNGKMGVMDAALWGIGADNRAHYRIQAFKDGDAAYFIEWEFKYKSENGTPFKSFGTVTYLQQGDGEKITGLGFWPRLKTDHTMGASTKSFIKGQFY